MMKIEDDAEAMLATDPNTKLATRTSKLKRRALFFAFALPISATAAVTIGFDLTTFPDEVAVSTPDSVSIPFQFVGAGSYSVDDVSLAVRYASGSSGLNISISDALQTAYQTFPNPSSFSATNEVIGTGIAAFSPDGGLLLNGDTTYFLNVYNFDADGPAQWWRVGGSGPALGTFDSGVLSPLTMPLGDFDGVNYYYRSLGSGGSSPLQGIVNGALGGFSITATAVPESSAYALLAGLWALSLGVVVRLRRR